MTPYASILQCMTWFWCCVTLFVRLFQTFKDFVWLQVNLWVSVDQSCPLTLFDLIELSLTWLFTCFTLGDSVWLWLTLLIACCAKKGVYQSIRHVPLVTCNFNQRYQILPFNLSLIKSTSLEEVIAFFYRIWFFFNICYSVWICLIHEVILFATEKDSTAKCWDRISYKKNAWNACNWLIAYQIIGP